MAAVTWPPTPPTQEEQAAHQDLAKEVRTLLANFKVPYYIWGKLSADGYTSLRDIADRWRTKDEAREKAAADYEFTADKNHFDEKSSLRASIRLSQAVDDAKYLVASGVGRFRSNIGLASPHTTGGHRLCCLISAASATAMMNIYCAILATEGGCDGVCC